MGKKPESKHLSFVGNVIEIHYRLTAYTSYSELARAVDIDPSYLSRIRYGEKVRVNTEVWVNLAVSLANAQAQSGNCPPEEMFKQAKYIYTQLMVALVEEDSFAQLAEGHLQDLNERRAIREEQNRHDRKCWEEKREDRRREKDSEKRRKTSEEDDQEEKPAADK